MIKYPIEYVQFLVVTDNENILFKPVKEPSLARPAGLASTAAGPGFHLTKKGYICVLKLTFR